jgi:hypothetical protein
MHFMVQQKLHRCCGGGSCSPPFPNQKNGGGTGWTRLPSPSSLRAAGGQFSACTHIIAGDVAVQHDKSILCVCVCVYTCIGDKASARKITLTKHYGFP